MKGMPSGIMAADGQGAGSVRDKEMRAHTPSLGNLDQPGGSTVLGLDSPWSTISQFSVPALR